MRRANRRQYFLMAMAACGIGVPVCAHAAAAHSGIPVLVYHRLDAQKTGLTTVKTANFVAQLDWLAAHHYQLVPLRAVVAMVHGAPATRSVAITVDDGHESVYRLMYPILRARHLPVTLFIYPSAISRADYALSWGQLREMMASGLVDVQSHTYWHPNFHQEKAHRTADDYQHFVDIQLRRSKEILQQQLKASITMIAWPYGIVDDGLAAAARRAGYEAGFAFAGGWAVAGADTMQIARIPVAGDVTLTGFAAFFDENQKIRTQK